MIHFGFDRFDAGRLETRQERVVEIGRDRCDDTATNHMFVKNQFGSNSGRCADSACHGSARLVAVHDQRRGLTTFAAVGLLQHELMFEQHKIALALVVAHARVHVRCQRLDRRATLRHVVFGREQTEPAHRPDHSRRLALTTRRVELQVTNDTRFDVVAGKIRQHGGNCRAPRNRRRTFGKHGVLGLVDETELCDGVENQREAAVAQGAAQERRCVRHAIHFGVVQ
mmetsp:Transcript_12296/g.20658  ORF Transcript_12296/g.20658 Transcript_12296/m.20658 type:complete len:226 (-) Transcript_12296:2188-2865(-)